jgi:hypothetical protein
MSEKLTRKLWIGGALWLSVATGAVAEPASPLCEDGECAPMISLTKFNTAEAYKLTDGKSEAIIVPSLGRVMSYRLVDGPNFLWVAPPKQYKPNEWKNLGGDKTWPAPQSMWDPWTGKGWPPPTAWDGASHRAEVITGGKLRTISPVAPGIGARIIREYGFNAQGELEVGQIVEKTSGSPISLSTWMVTQIVHPDAVFLPTNADSPYKNNFHWMAAPKKPVNTSAISPTLLMAQTSRDTDYKIGVDAPFVAIAAVKDGVAFVQRAANASGDYPDGAAGAGFPVELYNNSGHGLFYAELELLSPMRTYKTGTSFKHTVRWSLHRLSADDVNSAEVHNAMQKLLSS